MKTGNLKGESTQYRSKSPAQHHFSPKFALPQWPEIGDNARLRPELRARCHYRLLLRGIARYNCRLFPPSITFWI
jgi:hypothetical protein